MVPGLLCPQHQFLKKFRIVSISVCLFIWHCTVGTWRFILGLNIKSLPKSFCNRKGIQQEILLFSVSQTETP
jgi:hypothetical protein